MGKNYYADLRRSYSSEESPFKAIKILNENESDDEELEEALFQASKHTAEFDVLYLWFAQAKLPNQKNAAGLMKQLATVDPHAGLAKNECWMQALRWCNTVEFDTKYPRSGSTRWTYLTRRSTRITPL